jgi:predicted metal-binding membrane protein
VVLLVLAALAWAVTGRLAEPHMRMGLLTGADGMAVGAGRGALPALGLFLVTWTVMMVAMMFPSVLPVVLTYDRWVRRAGRSRAATLLFVSGYLLVWAAGGTVAYAVVVHLVPLLPSGATGVRLGGAVLVLAGAYQFTPLKRVCLRQCRSPLAFVAAHADRLRAGPLSRAGVGAAHGAYCLGCCWALMVVLVLLGMMSLTWMALVAAVILVEKVFPGGGAVGRAVGALLVVAGAALLIGAPSLPAPA